MINISKKLGGCLAGMMLALCVYGQSAQQGVDYRVVPLPQSVLPIQGGSFQIASGMTVSYPKGNKKMQRNAAFLVDYLKQISGIELSPMNGKNNRVAITLSLGLQNPNKDAYQIVVTDKGIYIQGASESGVFYGIQTLRKSIPVATVSTINFPQVVVSDQPRFSYRGSMLDTSRHFFPVDFIKKYIDLLTLHNINNFHWHITDDQGWRFEVKRYPELAAKGSKRTETVIGHNTGKFDGIPYEGFYTQEDCKEIVRYAAERYINIIPEIDMPGHMLAALSVFPELGCTGGPYEVEKTWGVFDDVLCAGNPKTIEFIHNVLAELIKIFPSHYIHVGGDECPKTRWKSCPKCQAKAKELGFSEKGGHTVEEQLQSYIIREAEKYLNQHGRDMIGWDETLEGGLAPNATVMSWRGFEGGVQAARQNHDVIMSPTSHCYFDYYQSTEKQTEPMAIGGYLPVHTVYNFEPVPSILTDAQKQHIIGAQCNLWTEYILDGKQVEYMLLPRMSAMSEVQWTQANRKNYDDFLVRVPHMTAIYDKLGYNYGKHLFDVKAELTPNTTDGTLDITLSTIDGADIYYTLDGTDPNLQSIKYKDIIKIKSGVTLKAQVIRSNGNKSKVYTTRVAFSKSSMKPITMLQPINSTFKYKGAPTLVDGRKGVHNYKTGEWIAFYTNDMEAVIDLKEPTEISECALSTCVEKGDWVFDTRGITVEVSEDGKTYTQVAKEDYPVMQASDPNKIYHHKLTFKPIKTRYVKVTALVERTLPEWHSGKGKPAFLFVDEIELN